MAIAQGQCPNCGAPNEFTAGASVSKVCPYCRHVILRTDRDWRNLGRAADLANTPSRLSVGDRGTVRGVAFEVVGRVQLDYGSGPWDEFYVSFSSGTWGWIAEAQGNLYVTQLSQEPIAVPPASALELDQPVAIGRYGTFKVAERRTARVLTAEGELPFQPAPQRFYADLHGPGGAFATFDYGDGTRPPEVFLGHQVPVAEVQVTPRGGERPGAQKVKLEAITCPNCGGALPPPKDPAIERVACKYCNAVSDLASMQVIARQAAAYARPRIPIGSTANLSGAQYTVIGYVERSAMIEGERFRWYEYLLYGENVGFRWLVDDEGNWLFVRPLSNADVHVVGHTASWHGRSFVLRNNNEARVDYVLGEFYWKVEVGETVRATDYVSGSDVLSREQGRDEVSWSYGTPVAWSHIAQAFGLPASAAPPATDLQGYTYSTASAGGAKLSVPAWVFVFIVVFACIFVIAMADEGGGGGAYYTGGGGSFGGFGGK
jgi:hypothetical protein